MPRTSKTPLTRAGQILERQRERAGLSKTQVAERMGSSRPQYDRVVFAGHPRPGVGSFIAAAEAVRADVSQVLRLAGYDPALVDETRRTDQNEQGPARKVMRLAG